MKRLLFVTAFALVACVFQSNAQTSVPFYGFELSNYEVGDTLEYYNVAWSGAFDHSSQGYKAWVIIGKEVTGNDSTLFTAAHTELYSWSINGSPMQQEFVQDTVQWLLINNAVYGNGNNILGDTMLAADSAGTLEYDTVTDLKHILVAGQNSDADYNYEATQNLGIITYQLSGGGPDDEDFYDDNLSFAHLEHYGIYGAYSPLYLAVDVAKPIAPVVTYNDEDRTIRASAAQPNEWLKLYDVLGRCVLTADINAEQIPVGQLNQGIYFYAVIGHQTASGKLWIR